MACITGVSSWGVLLGTVEYEPEKYDAEIYRPSSTRFREKGRGL